MAHDNVNIKMYKMAKIRCRKLYILILTFLYEKYDKIQLL